MTDQELIIFITGLALGFAGAGLLMAIAYAVLTVREKIADIKYRKEHRMEMLMMEQAEIGLEDRFE